MTDVESPAAPAPPADARTLGLPQATALIVGSIIGVGIFNLPYSLAAIGPISIVAMALTTVGALALALMFAVLSRRLPADGGPYAYARAAFGNGVGFANAWSYWITAWAGNAAIVTGWVFYVEYFVNDDGVTGWSIAIGVIGLWLPALVNLTGAQNMGAVQLWTTVVKFIPLAIMSTVGLLFISAGNFTPWNVSGDSNPMAIGSAMAICLFSYLGVETAAVAAAKVRDPAHNVPRATVYGTLGSAVVYLLSMIAVFGTVPTAILAEDANKASYSVAATTMAGADWAGDLTALAVIVSGFGALNGWTMICAEMPLAAAKDGVFPAVFGRLTRRRVPVVGILASAALASLAMVISYLGASGATVFNTLVLMTGITAAIPYAFLALAQLKWRLADRRAGIGRRFVRDAGVAAPLAVDHEVVITHGNGPQVGMLALQSAADPALEIPYPFDVLGAQTQGMIGYWLLQALQNALPGRQVAAVLDQTLVSAADPAFAAPTKFVGPVYDEKAARRSDTSRRLRRSERSASAAVSSGHGGPASAGALVVAHVSDLHVGAHLPGTLGALAADVVASAPALTVVTGDSTMRARTGQFRRARELLDQLPGPVLATTGNHDVPLGPERLFAPYARYRDWIAAELDPVVRVPGLTAVGLQSMPRWRWKNGRVTRRQTEHVLATLATAPAHDIRLLALHHPPFATGTARLVGRARLERAIRTAGVDLVLAGHTHVPDVRAMDPAPGNDPSPTVVVVAGTATSRRHRGAGHSWSRIAIGPEAIVVCERYLGPLGWYTGRVIRCPRLATGLE